MWQQVEKGMEVGDRKAAAKADGPTPERLVHNLCKLLSVRPAGNDTFEGMALPKGAGRVFGGQVIGQALMAAGATVDGRDPHSLHAYFLRPGDNAQPIQFTVGRDLDGGTFSNRRVTASQQGKPILTMAASFHSGDRGFVHTVPMPDVPGPDEAFSDADWARANPSSVPPALLRRIMRPRPVEMRRLVPPIVNSGRAEDAAHAIWVRTVAPPEEASQLLHCAILAFLSDMGLMSTALRPHGVDWSQPGLQGASIDHAIWFHDPIDVRQWHLYAMDSPWADHGRGMNRGLIFAADGRLVATTAQEGLNRLRDPS